MSAWVIRALSRSVELGLLPRVRRFARSLAEPARAYDTTMARLARGLERTAYGSHLGVQTAGQFAARVPVVDYPDLQPWLARQQAGEAGVVTREPVLAWERTGGSTGEAKSVPVTRSLRSAQTAMVLLQVHSMLARGPRLRTGRFYRPVSPRILSASRPEPLGGDGFADDFEGLSPPVRWFLHRFEAGPRGAGSIRDLSVFRGCVMGGLMEARDLEVVLLYSPAFLGTLLDHVEAERGPQDWRAIWPELKLLMCWAGGQEAAGARVLADRLGAQLHPMGLFSTEGPVTVTRFGERGGLPLTHWVLIELETEDGDLIPAHEARHGRVYRTVISHGAGLYRYRVGDQVEVVGRVAQTPTFEFVGRQGFVGPGRLHDRFVREVLGALALSAGFQSLVSVTDSKRYVLLLDRCEDPDGVAARLEALLGEHMTYANARRQKGLGPAGVFVREDIAARVLEAEARSGRLMGDAKHEAVHKRPVDAEFARWLGMPEPV